ncbi:MAG: hypothetical protein Q4B73_08495 [Lachnospiraceae bacterium]|nr:hypothetical protein [Lachnospiraceae bacterium]
MLSDEQCLLIAREKCEALFGEKFIREHRPEFCSTRYSDNKLFEYSLLWSPFDDEPTGIVIEEKPFDYYVSVIVNKVDGSVIVDESMTKLPE